MSLSSSAMNSRAVLHQTNDQGELLDAFIGLGAVAWLASIIRVHPHGVRYTKDNEGAHDLFAGAGGNVAPGGRFSYTWTADESSGPGPADPSSIVWWYHSHVADHLDAGMLTTWTATPWSIDDFSMRPVKSGFQITGLTKVASGWQIAWPSKVGKNYSVESAATLGAGVFQAVPGLQSVAASDGIAASAVDSRSNLGSTQFYRVVELP